ncbi:hypothetical protein MKW94_004124 [Papaver nudicaule]|uniref:Gamma-interferon-inducible lysosomal thiol reductase n=1 Tax=Papaver nudicaule TaxID=74823 RepID=A0AA41RLG4_PAPNU|nr:hypothetical protein [Papaver nudicaule]
MSVLALVVLLFCSSTQLSSSAQVTTVLSSPSPAGAANKVNLSLYYETLCPGCSDFMVNYLPKIFENGLIDIIDLKLIPYGNAKISADKVLTCQHGPKECLLNTVEACALHVWPALLEIEYAKVTGDLKPPHDFVPWVTVNNEPLINETINFQTYVCNAYKGPKPAACQGQQMDITPEA